MLIYRSLAVRLALVSLVTVATIFFISTAAVYTIIRGVLLEKTEVLSRELVRATANEILIPLNEVVGAGKSLSVHLSMGAYQPQELFPLLDEIVRQSDVIAGVSVNYEPFAALADQRYFGPFSYRTPDGIARMSLGGQDFDTYTRDWYQIPALTAQPYWSEPSPSVVDPDRLVIIYSIPFFDSLGALQGVISLDVDLRDLVDIVNNVEIFDSGFAFLLSPSGRMISYPRQEWVMRESLFSLAQTLELPALRQLGRQIQRTREAFLTMPTGIFEQPAQLSYLRLPALDWTLGVVIPERELFADIRRVIAAILITGSVGFLMLLLAIVFISRSVTRPLKALVGGAQEIARGHLDRPLATIASQDEVGDLTRSFDEMRRSLRDYIQDLTRTTAAKERIESELEIARNIQMSFLPRRLTLEGSDLPVDLDAALLPAKAVGGDLYEFFWMDEGRRLFFAIGDVSDKGVPAALFMVVTKTLVKGFADQFLDPGEILYRVNNELCLNNDSGMFVTYLCGVLDLETGEVKFANAGHNPPLLARANGQHAWLKLAPGLVLGGIEDMVFPVSTVELKPGDSLLLYTDGVTEACNPENELFGEAALEATYAKIKTSPATEQVRAVFEAVHLHADGAEQSDDIAALVLRYRPGS